MSDAKRQIGTRTLAALIPDCESLLADPESYLIHGHVRIGPRRISWWMFMIVPACLGLGISLIPANIGYALVISSPVFLGTLIYWVWPVRRELILRPEVVEFVRNDDVVRCPWSLFDATGQAFVRLSRLIDTEVALPIRLDAVPFIENVRDGSVIATGRTTNSKQFWFLSDEELGIASVYELRPQDLGDLLLRVGRILGGTSTGHEEWFRERIPQTTSITSVGPEAVVSPGTLPSPREITEQSDAESVDIKRFPAADRYGWVTVPVTQLSFARLCCECCSPSFDRCNIQIEEGFRWQMLVPFFGRFRRERTLEVRAPLCPACRRKYVAWQVALSLLVLLLGFAPFGFLVLIAFAGLDLTVGLLLFGAALVLARISTLFRRDPFHARYNESARTVSLRFRHGHSAERILGQ
ncbi:MAG: hypothetical protein K2X38_03280 [Gemmataceae bacterium]|nr:hypothetical protein [Gemmataceae bacterium]